MMSRGSLWWIIGSVVWLAVTIPLSIVVMTCSVTDNSASCDNPSTTLFVLQALATFTFTIVWTLFGVQFFMYQKGSTAEDSHSQYLQMQLDAASGESISDRMTFFGIGVLGLVLCAEYVIMANTKSMYDFLTTYFWFQPFGNVTIAIIMFASPSWVGHHLQQQHDTGAHNMGRTTVKTYKDLTEMLLKASEKASAQNRYDPLMHGLNPTETDLEEGAGI